MFNIPHIPNNMIGVNHRMLCAQVRSFNRGNPSKCLSQRGWCCCSWGIPHHHDLLLRMHLIVARQPIPTRHYLTPKTVTFSPNVEFFHLSDFVRILQRLLFPFFLIFFRLFLFYFPHSSRFLLLSCYWCLYGYQIWWISVFLPLKNVIPFKFNVTYNHFFPDFNFH